MNFRSASALIVLLAVPIGATPAVAATAHCPSQVDVRNVMTVNQYDQTGLDKLDKTHRAAFNRWLTRYVRHFCAGPAHQESTSRARSATTQCPSRVDIRDVMTVNQYDRTGLAALNEKQLAALDAWLAGYIRKHCTASRRPRAAGGAGGTGEASSPPAPGGENTAPEENAEAGPAGSRENTGRVESRIAGKFHGWTGNTTFRLENGHVWKQAGPGYFRVDLDNPKVVIKKLLIGYVLKVDGFGKEVFVRRIR